MSLFIVVYNHPYGAKNLGTYNSFEDAVEIAKKLAAYDKQKYSHERSKTYETEDHFYIDVRVGSIMVNKIQHNAKFAKVKKEFY